MATRKVMAIGRSHCITLPKELAEDLRLKKGEELYVDLAGNIVFVGRLVTIKEKKPVNVVLNLLSDVIKIRTKLDEEWEKYGSGELSEFELISNTGEANDRLLEIGSSIERLIQEKVRPIKTKLNLKFIDPEISSGDMIAGIEALMMEGYERALNNLGSEIAHMIEHRRKLDIAVKKIDKALQKYDKRFRRDLIQIKSDCRQKIGMIEEFLKEVKDLIQNTSKPSSLGV